MPWTDAKQTERESEVQKHRAIVPPRQVNAPSAKDEMLNSKGVWRLLIYISNLHLAAAMINLQFVRSHTIKHTVPFLISINLLVYVKCGRFRTTILIAYLSRGLHRM